MREPSTRATGRVGGSSAVARDAAARAPMPEVRFDAVPAVGRAVGLADRLRRDLGVDPCAPVDPELVAGTIGWPVRLARLGAADGGLQALLTPRSVGGFAVVVDPDPTPAQHELLDGQEPGLHLLRWARLAHELAHVFFYAHGRPPRRWLEPSEAEERFCDAFAAALLARPLRGMLPSLVEADLTARDAVAVSGPA